MAISAFKLSAFSEKLSSQAFSYRLVQNTWMVFLMFGSVQREVSVGAFRFRPAYGDISQQNKKMIR
jgi:hypothetical protein